MTTAEPDPKSAGATQDDKTEGQQQQGQGQEPETLTAESVAKMIQKETDKIRTEYSKKVKDLEAEKERLIQEKMTEEEKREHQLKSLQADLTAKEQALRGRELEHHAIGVIQQQQLPLDFVPFIRGSSEDDTLARVETFKTAWQKAIQAAVDERFRSVGGDQRRSQDNDPGQSNPWKKESFNLTKQGEIFKKDPALAAKLIAAAGAR